MWCWIGPCVENEEKYSKAIDVIFENMYDIKYGIQSTLKNDVEGQEKVAFAFFQKLGEKKNIEDVAKFVLDMKSKIAIKKIENQKKELSEDEELDNDVFADLTDKKTIDDWETKEEA